MCVSYGQIFRVSATFSILKITCFSTLSLRACTSSVMAVTSVVASHVPRLSGLAFLGISNTDRRPRGLVCGDLYCVGGVVNGWLARNVACSGGSWWSDSLSVFAPHHFSPLVLFPTLLNVLQMLSTVLPYCFALDNASELVLGAAHLPSVHPSFFK